MSFGKLTKRVMTLSCLAVSSFAIVSRGAHAAPPSCSQFKERLSAASARIGVPLPPILFEPNGVNTFRSSVHRFRTERLPLPEGANGDLSCSDPRRFEQISIMQFGSGSDWRTERLFLDLVIAVTWAYSSWPPTRVQKAIDKLAADARANVNESSASKEGKPTAKETQKRGEAMLAIEKDVEGTMAADTQGLVDFYLDARYWEPKRQ
jgi:hypothetical protein